MSDVRKQLIKEIQMRLGLGMIDLEADPEHYEMAVTMAIDRYRQRATNAMEESFEFLDLQRDVNIYYLDPGIQVVKQVFRRGIGSNSGTGAQIDPFSLAYTNNLYLLANPGQVQQPGMAGSLATYDFAMQYQELAGRMFGRDIIFNYDPSTRKILLDRKFGAEETVLLWVMKAKPDDIIISDVYSKPWIRDYSVAAAKFIIGEARSKFNQIAGPQGGFTLNGDALKEEAQAEMDRLEHEVMAQIDGGNSVGYGFSIG